MPPKTVLFVIRIVLKSRASVKRKDVVRRPTAEEDCLAPITSRRSGAYKAAGIYLNL